MLSYVFKRLLALIPTVAVPMVLLFVLLRLTPGDPAAVILGENATATEIAELRTELGLDAPMWQQFLDWLARMARFDFGESIFLHAPVAELVLSAALVTGQLALISMLLALLIGPALGAVAGATRSRALDRTMVVGSAVGVAMPTFWLAILMVMLFGVTLQWLPVAGFTPITEDPVQYVRYMALPCLALGTLEAATLFRYSRNGVLDAKHQPFVATARAQGLPERTITRSYVFPAALAPLVTVVGLSLASMLGGAVVTENVFSLPGLGKLLLTAVERRDYPLIEGCIFFIAVAFVLVNLLVDVVAATLDPRIRLEAKE
ncbi:MULTISPECIES: ABC transporter permease [Nocardiopsis]|uniref:ABC transporter permease n=3 Tax=Nocardiopsis TaxID=2013 RepID=A0A975L6S2_9ACTN|nr:MULTISPECIES: ABC transporter permease [Nocardiopsis]AFR07690.1 binding--dependent transport system inner membrane component family protein [Nocardiopsis alba ATCC BAA-2165]PWV54867.1 peptide/nickel transport system permease protein [Nocardiopsis sp. L17-MgMaSL7]QVJ00449.1 ABC transporter permease [Nocardiopsis eucommiae]